MFDRMFNGNELFFYRRVKRKYLSSRHSDRITRVGYWKVTGKECAIMSEDTNEQIGIEKMLVFYEGRVPKSKRTDWVMHEYYLNSKCLGNDHGKGEMLPYVACRIKNKKDKKLMMGRAPTISPERYSSSPYKGTSNGSDPPGNQVGDLPSFCITLNNEVADNQEAADAQPEMSVIELMESLTVDDPVLDCNNASTFQSLAAVFAQPMSREEYVDLLPQLDTLDVSDCIYSPFYQPVSPTYEPLSPIYEPQLGAEEGSSPFFN